jgi:hypothetical protein
MSTHASRGIAQTCAAIDGEPQSRDPVKACHPNPDPHAVILGFIPRIHFVIAGNQVSAIDWNRYWILGTSPRMTDGG